jgi:hypothetical protein
LLAHELRHGEGCALAGSGEVEHPREDVSLGADRVVDRLHRDPGLLGDLADRGAVVAALQKQPRGRFNDHPLGFLGGDLLPVLDSTHPVSIPCQ